MIFYREVAQSHGLHTATRAAAETPRTLPTGEAAERVSEPLGMWAGRIGRKPRDGRPLSGTPLPVAPPSHAAAEAPRPPLLAMPVSWAGSPILQAPEPLLLASSVQAQCLSPLTPQLLT